MKIILEAFNDWVNCHHTLPINIDNQVPQSCSELLRPLTLDTNIAGKTMSNSYPSLYFFLLLPFHYFDSTQASPCCLCASQLFASAAGCTHLYTLGTVQRGVRSFHFRFTTNASDILRHTQIPLEFTYLFIISKWLIFYIWI